MVSSTAATNSAVEDSSDEVYTNSVYWKGNGGRWWEALNWTSPDYRYINRRVLPTTLPTDSSSTVSTTLTLPELLRDYTQKPQLFHDYTQKPNIIDQSEGSIGLRTTSNTRNATSVALTATLASLAAVVVVLIILIGYFGYTRWVAFIGCF